MTRRRPVQACITSIGFPDSLDGLLDMFDKNEGFGPGHTDIDTLLEWEPGCGLQWTAPQWLTAGDVLLFYHSLRGDKAIRRLSRMREEKAEKEVGIALERARHLADRFSGTVFGFAIVDAATEYHDDVADMSHFRSRLFASLGKVGIFKYPLPLATLSKHVKLSTGGTITPLSGLAFDNLLAELAARNPLPSSLRSVRGADLGFRSVSSGNWLDIIPSSRTRFIHETQVRSYFADYLLSAIRDPRTALLEECHCFHRGRLTGVADYFVRIGSMWIPVETKLSITVQRNLREQVRRYCRATRIRPSKGPLRGKLVEVPQPLIALVIDHTGLYVLRGKRLKPLLSRSSLTQRSIATARSKLRDLVAASA